MIDLNYARASLPYNVEKGQAVSLRIELPPVKDPGDYWLKFDMVCEHIDWFESAGSRILWKKFRVTE